MSYVDISTIEDASKSIINGAIFTVNSGKFAITDPCYSNIVGSRCSHIVDASNGLWKSKVGLNEDERVAYLHVYHSDSCSSHLSFFNLRSQACELIGKCSVDSGTLGFFDADWYSRFDGGEAINPVVENSVFWSKIESSVVSPTDQSIEGVFSSTGWGDGCYSVFARKNSQGAIFEAIALFIYDEANEDEEEENEDDENEVLSHNKVPYRPIKYHTDKY